MKAIETNRRDRKCIKNIRYIANKLGHQEVASDVFAGAYITYHYNAVYKMLIIKRNKQKILINHYPEFEAGIIESDKTHKPRVL